MMATGNQSTPHLLNRVNGPGWGGLLAWLCSFDSNQDRRFAETSRDRAAKEGMEVRFDALIPDVSGSWGYFGLLRGVGDEK